MAQIPIETFRSLDEALSAKLVKAWQDQYVQLTASIARAMDRGDFEKADQLVERFDLQKIWRKERRTVEMIGMSSALFGQSRITELGETSFEKRKTVPDEVRNATRQFGVMMDDLTEMVKKAARKVIADVVAENKAEEDRAFKQEVRKAPTRIREFTSFLNTAVGKAGENSIQIASGLHTSRLSAWGFTTEANLRGITHFKVDEQLDSRICPVCREMNGRTFQVQPAHDRLDSTLKITDPKELRTVAPWPKQNKAAVADLRKMTPEQITLNGWDTPPYHPRCRGILVPGKQSDFAAAVSAAARQVNVAGGLIAGLGNEVVEGPPEEQAVKSGVVSPRALQRAREQLAEGLDIEAVMRKNNLDEETVQSLRDATPET